MNRGTDAEIVKGFGHYESYDNRCSEIRNFASTKL